ncbi:MAG: ABCB family ABC transporter ATP-binding protein/permease [bacterium]
MRNRKDSYSHLETETHSSLSTQLNTLTKLWPRIWPAGNRNYQLRVIGAFLVILTGQAILVAAPFLLATIVNRLENYDPQMGIISSVFAIIIGYGLFRIFSIAIPQIREFLFSRVGQNAQRQVALSVFRHLHTISLRFHLERRTGGLSRVIERGIKSIDFIFRFLLFNIGPMLINLILVSIVFAKAYSPIYSLIVLLTVIGYIWFTIATTEWRLKFRRDMNQKDTEANSKAIDSLLNYETVKYFNNENYEAARYNRAMCGFQEAAIRSNNSLAVVNIGQAVIFQTGTVALLLLTAKGIMEGQMQVGAITAIILIMMNLQQPLNILGFAYREIKQSLIDMEKMFQLLDIEPEIKDSPAAKPLIEKGGEIEFENVDFHYDVNRPILNNISFKVQSGQTIAFVGHSGAGKSTISRILYRFYDIVSGRILIDGQDIQDITQDSLRKAIGMVPQDTVLFNDTIRYNIEYALPGATDDEIEQAAKLAQIHDFILSLPDGYNTMVGERGLKLSGGEKQRVAIARTILKNPPILILDEATSALDIVTEKEIQSALRTISQDRTTLVIAHRLSTIIDADQIIVLDKGRVIEQGTHADLLAQNGVYANLWQQQQDSHNLAAE